MNQTYQINHSSDNLRSRVFILQKSELEKRWDPYFYLNRVEIKNAIKLSKLVDIKGGKRIPKDHYYSSEPTDYRYLRVESISEYGFINWTNLKFISSEIYDILKRYRIGKGDVVISIAGTIGKIACIDEDICNIILTENCVKLVIRDKETLLPKFLQILLQLSTSQMQMQQGFIQTTIPKLGIDKIEEILLPKIPPIEKQLEIITFYENSISQKQQNEANAEKLLISIDDYLLKELGITLPEPPENTLKNRMFKSILSKLSGNRMDCYYYFTEDVETQINNGLYKSANFSSLFNSLINGFDFRDYKESGTPYIKVANVRKGEFDFSKMQFIELDSTGISKAIQLKKGNILLTRKGTFGYTLCLENDFDYVISSEIFYIELKHEILNSKYLEIFFNSVMGQKQFDRVKIGAIMGSLSQEAVKSLRIPLPPLTKQIEIANHITAIRQQAQQLKGQTKEALAQAGKEIENLLLETV